MRLACLLGFQMVRSRLGVDSALSRGMGVPGQKGLAISMLTWQDLEARHRCRWRGPQRELRSFQRPHTSCARHRPLPAMQRRGFCSVLLIIGCAMWGVRPTLAISIKTWSNMSLQVAD